MKKSTLKAVLEILERDWLSSFTKEQLAIAEISDREDMSWKEAEDEIEWILNA